MKIFILAHKDFQNNITNPVYSIVVDDKSKLKNNYSNLNIIYADKGKLYNLSRAYSEMAKIYYIYQLYKNGTINSKYIGFNHYRRYFSFKDNIPNIEDIFYNYEVILNKPMILLKGMKNNYCRNHICKKYDEILDIIKDIRPEYYDIALNTKSLKSFYCCNLFIMKKEDFYNYCEFMFDILFEFDKRNNFRNDKDVIKYTKNLYKKKQNYFIQTRIEAFLSERIGNIFYYKNFKKIKIFNVSL